MGPTQPVQGCPIKQIEAEVGTPGNKVASRSRSRCGSMMIAGVREDLGRKGVRRRL